jgi:hypothetical protein
MEIKAKTRTEQILVVMYILAWVAFIGYLIQAGAVLLSYSLSTVDRESARNLSKGMDLFQLRQYNFWHYTLRVSFIVAGMILKVYAANLAIKTLSKVKLENPFQFDVALKIERISYVLFGVWIVAMCQNGHAFWLSTNTDINLNWASGEFIFAAGMVYVVAQIFKRGVEIQTELDQTV